MGLLDFLFGSNPSPDERADSDTLRRIVDQLEALEPERARWIAAFAYVLSRAANADLEITGAEVRRREELVAKVGGLPEAQAVLAVEIARSQARLFGGTEDYLVTRELSRCLVDAPQEERERVLDCLFSVSAADGVISGAEDTALRQIASELGFTHGDFVRVRSRWSHRRSVLRDPAAGG